MPEGQALEPLEQEEVLKRVGMALLDCAPEDWVEIRCKYSGLVGISTVGTEATVGSGKVHWIDPPDSVWNELDRLRVGMYIRGKGNWFSLQYTIERPGRFRVVYDYENPPDFDIPPVDESFALEQKHYPRSEENIPGWLQEKLQSSEGNPD